MVASMANHSQTISRIHYTFISPGYFTPSHTRNSLHRCGLFFAVRLATKAFTGLLLIDLLFVLGVLL